MCQFLSLPAKTFSYRFTSNGWPVETLFYAYPISCLKHTHTHTKQLEIELLMINLISCWNSVKRPHLKVFTTVYHHNYTVFLVLIYELKSNSVVKIGCFFFFVFISYESISWSLNFRSLYHLLFKYSNSSSPATISQTFLLSWDKILQFHYLEVSKYNHKHHKSWFIPNM